MSVPQLIRIAYLPDSRTPHVGRFAAGQFFGDVVGTSADSISGITVVLHLFDHVGHHVSSDIRPDVPLAIAEGFLISMIDELPAVARGDIAVRLFDFESHGVRWALVDRSDEDGQHVELLPQRLGFREPWDGAYST